MYVSMKVFTSVEVQSVFICLIGRVCQSLCICLPVLVSDFMSIYTLKTHTSKISI